MTQPDTGSRRRARRSWLDGPPPSPRAGHGWAGQRLGRPRSGPGSVAGWGRRLAAVGLDWLLCLAVARGLLHADAQTVPGAFAAPGVFAASQLLLVGTLGSSIGQRLFGLRIEQVSGRPAGPLRAAVRTALLCLAVPALIWDCDGRGLHDKAAGTVVVRL